MNFLRHFYPNKKIIAHSAAILAGEESISYEQLDSEARKAALHLKSIGINENDKAAVVANNSPDFIYLILGLWEIGAVPVILNLRLLPKEIKSLAEFSGCNTILTDRGDCGEIDAPSTRVVNFPFTKLQGSSLSIKYAHHDLSRTALIMFTSGSSGKPKGVIISFGNLLHSAEAGNEYFRLNENDRYLASLPFFHIGGFSVIVRTFCSGACIILPDSLEIKNISAVIEEKNPSAISLVTTQLKRMLDGGVSPNPGLRSVLLGGGFIDEELVRRALSKGWPAAKSYGSTETSSFITVLAPEHFKGKSGSAGRPLNNNKIIIVNDERNPLPALQTGEIAVKSGSTASGYLNNPEETSKKFIDGIYYSGDFGYLDADGFLFVSARRSDLIISGGENIVPSEIENALKLHPIIKDACVFGIDDPLWGQAVAAALITEDFQIITTFDLKDFLKDKVEGFKHPKKLFFVEDFPRSELGKVLKEKLKEILGVC